MLFRRTVSDKTLVERVLRGQRDEFARLVERYLPMVHALAYAQVGNATDADDVAQETFLKAFTSLDTLHNRGAFRPWLAAIARNAALSIVRMRKATTSLDPNMPADGDVVRDAERRDLHEVLRREILLLDPEFREVLLLHYFSGLKIREVAETIGASPEATAKRIQRARDALGSNLVRELGLVSSDEQPDWRKGRAKIMAAIAAAPVACEATAMAGVGGGVSLTVAVVVLAVLAAMAGVIALVSEPVGESVSASGASSATTAESVGEPVKVADFERPQASNATEAAAVEPTHETAEDVLLIELSPPPHDGSAIRISGRVDDEAGTAIAGAKLMLYHLTANFAPEGTIHQTESKSDGSFAFSESVTFDAPVKHVYGRDSFAILASHPTYALGWKNVRLGEDTENLRVLMTRAVSRTLTVVDDDGLPIEGAEVQPRNLGSHTSNAAHFRDYFRITGDIPFSTVTDVNGQAAFANLPDTQVGFTAHKDGYARGITWSDLLTLRKGAKVSGRVITASGAPVAGARVTLEATLYHHYEYAISDEAGNYAFVDVPPSNTHGRYNVMLRDSPYAIGDTELTLEPADSITGFDLIAHRATLVRLRVAAHETGAPLAGVRVEGFDPHGQRVGGFTDDFGVCDVRMSPGVARAWILSPRDGTCFFVEDMLHETKVEFEVTNKDIEIVLQAPPVGTLTTISGRVEWPNDYEGDRSAVVYVSTGSGLYTPTKGGGYGAETGANEDGTYSFDEAPVGIPMAVYAESSDLTMVGVLFCDAPSPQDHPVLPDVPMEPCYSVDFAIRDESGAPVTGTVARVGPVVEGIWMSRVSREIPIDEFGTVRIDGVIQGLEYKVETGPHLDSETDPPHTSQIVVLQP